MSPRSLLLASLLGSVLLTGCVNNRARSPVAAGLNTRDLYDVQAQAVADSEADPVLNPEHLRRAPLPSSGKTVLCLSGGGSYGAYSAGVVCGWTARGDRPNFDVVTGISTGALAAPFAFLGPDYDGDLERFYTTLRTRDVYRLRPVRGLFTESLADNTPLTKTLKQTITPELVAAIACEHAKGRRLYVGSTEVESRRFVVWDVGAIASRGTPEARELVIQVLLASSAIPGFFIPQYIPVTVDGQRYVERHVDGGASQALFFRPPILPPGVPPENALAGTDVYAVMAGKLYADPEKLRPRSFTVVASTTSTVLYAQGRGDLARLWTICQTAGMNFHMTAIPDDYPAPKDATSFDPKAMRGMFDEGVRQARAGAWRTTPPGTAPGEEPHVREGTELSFQPRVPIQR